MLTVLTQKPAFLSGNWDKSYWGAQLPTSKPKRYHSEALTTVTLGADTLPPGTIREIPFRRLAQAAFKRITRPPAQLIDYLARIKGVAQVMVGSILYECDKICVWLASSLEGQAHRLPRR
jgi:hypothetical protein